MTATALDLSTFSNVPEDDGTTAICGCKDFSAGTAFEGTDEFGVAGEDANALTGGEGPHADSFVDLVACGEDIGAVWMPCDLVDAGVVAHHHAEVGDVILAPDANGLVPAATDEVVSERSPANIPDWAFMAFVHNEASVGLQGPKTDGLVRGCRE